jgi:ADP-ribosylation factor-like protein 4
VPTIGFNCEKVKGTVGKSKGVGFLVWDVGGQDKIRALWKSYTRCTDGIIFVVDSCDMERMEEAKMELMRTAKSPDNQGTPLLILANKQDLPMAKEPKELEKLLGLHELNSPIALSLSVSSGSIEKSLAAASPSSSSTSCPLKTDQNPNKNFYIQAACAITGEGKTHFHFVINFFHLTFFVYFIAGLHEGLDHLYDLIIRKRKLQKHKKKR